MKYSNILNNECKNINVSPIREIIWVMVWYAEEKFLYDGYGLYCI